MDPVLVDPAPRTDWPTFLDLFSPTTAARLILRWTRKIGQEIKLGLLLRRTDLNDGQAVAVLAVRLARRDVRKAHPDQITWASFTLYGDPTFRVFS